MAALPGGPYSKKPRAAPCESQGCLLPLQLQPRSGRHPCASQAPLGWGWLSLSELSSRGIPDLCKQLQGKSKMLISGRRQAQRKEQEEWGKVPFLEGKFLPGMLFPPMMLFASPGGQSKGSRAAEEPREGPALGRVQTAQGMCTLLRLRFPLVHHFLHLQRNYAEQEPGSVLVGWVWIGTDRMLKGCKGEPGLGKSSILCRFFPAQVTFLSLYELLSTDLTAPRWKLEVW